MVPHRGRKAVLYLFGLSAERFAWVYLTVIRCDLQQAGEIVDGLERV